MVILECSSYDFVDGQSTCPSDLKSYAPIGWVLDKLYNIVHSDVQPENMIFSQNHAVLVDFDVPLPWWL